MNSDVILCIIKKHEPSIFRLKFCKNYKEYNLLFLDNKSLCFKILSEIEFNILKEWLESE